MSDLPSPQENANARTKSLRLQEENTRLKAEVERLRKLFADTERLMLLDGEYEAMKVGTYSGLQEEVARLRKAGDAMEVSLQADFNGCPYEPLVIGQVIHRWNAAKEGKQP